MREAWKIILEISTLLGGLAAAVFFYDRYKQREKSASLSRPSGGIFWRRAGAAICLFLCLILALIFIRYGQWIFIGRSFGVIALIFAASFILQAVDKGTDSLYGPATAILSGGLSAVIGCWAGLFLVIVINRFHGGDPDASLAGTGLAYAGAGIGLVASIAGFFSPIGQVGLDLMD